MFILPQIENVDLIGQYVVRNLSENPQCRTVHDGKNFINYPVNIDLVETFKRGVHEFNQASDLKAYTIVFLFTENKLTWYFKDEESRESEFNRILNKTE